MRGSKRALVVVDMPFGSYEESPSQAFHNAAKVIKETQCGAVKLEGGARMAETVHYLSQRGIPVMAHIGLTPQSINVLGGFKTQGRTRDAWAAIENDAKAVSEAGAFAVVLEAMTEPLARRITESIPIPTIGIGASPACDGVSRTHRNDSPQNTARIAAGTRNSHASPSLPGAGGVIGQKPFLQEVAHFLELDLVDVLHHLGVDVAVAGAGVSDLDRHLA